MPSVPLFTGPFSVQQIPFLLKLKHFPSVIFAGIDSPEDVVNDTYQELFRTGGFVISDDKILEHLTLGWSFIFLPLKSSQVHFSSPSDPNNIIAKIIN